MKTDRKNWVVRAPGDVERIEASFAGVAFSPHRHDTYAVGITLQGVQSFTYRGTARHSLPGQVVILHPDESHDGRAGDGGGFRYRAAYVAPADLQGALNGCALPFVASGVSIDEPLHRAVAALLADYERPLATLEYQDALYDLACALQRAAGATVPIKRANGQAATAARDYIEAHLDGAFSLAALEAATGQDRWQLSRDFRAMFGTSPYRYLTLRRLDRAREMMRAQSTIADAAFACGFSDQSHFGRLFKKTFGQTPKAWLTTAGHTHDRSRLA